MEKIKQYTYQIGRKKFYIYVLERDGIKKIFVDKNLNLKPSTIEKIKKKFG